MPVDSLFDVEFISRGQGRVGPFPKGKIEFSSGARVSLKEQTESRNSQIISGTYSDFGDCRIAIFTHKGVDPLEEQLMMKGLLLKEAQRPVFIGGFWWQNPMQQGPTIPPDDIGSWTATSGGNQGGGEG